MNTDPTLARRKRTPGPPTFWQLAHSLDAMSEGQRLTSIRSGFAVVWAEAAKSAFNMPSSHMAPLLNLSLSTFERRRKDAKPLDAIASERLDRLATIAILAEDIFEDKEAAARWMSTPNEALGGNTPVMQCKTEIGARQVRRILNAVEWGGVV